MMQLGNRGRSLRPCSPPSYPCAEDAQPNEGVSPIFSQTTHLQQYHDSDIRAAADDQGYGDANSERNKTLLFPHQAQPALFHIGSHFTTEDSNDSYYARRFSSYQEPVPEIPSVSHTEQSPYAPNDRSSNTLSSFGGMRQPSHISSGNTGIASLLTPGIFNPLCYSSIYNIDESADSVKQTFPMTSNSGLLLQDEHSPTTTSINPSDPYAIAAGSCHIKQEEGEPNRSQGWGREFCLALPGIEHFEDDQVPPVSSPPSSCVSPFMATASLSRTEIHPCPYTGCRTKWKRQSDLRKHLKTHIPRSTRPFACTKCTEKFLYDKDLKRHERSRHQSLTQGPLFKCTWDGCMYASRGFARKDKLNDHMRKKHQSQFRSATVYQTDESEADPVSSTKAKLSLYMCRFGDCDRVEGFKSPHDLERHQMSKHYSDMPGPRFVGYRCVVESCRGRDKVWPRLDNFRQHIIKVHPKEDVNSLIALAKRLALNIHIPADVS